MFAKCISPGEESGGFVVSVVLGMAGASLGGFVTSLVVGTGAIGFRRWSVLVAMLAAAILLYLYARIARHSARGDAKDPRALARRP